MIEDSRLLVLNGSDFKALIGESLIHEIDIEKAKLLLSEKDTVLLDVRYEEEWEESRLPGAKLIPLPELRNRLSEIEQQKKYIIYDRNGKRSIIAAMILQQLSVQAYSIAGGIVGWPYDIDESVL
jgi:rhodanese-related sulfurtransferase